MTQLQVRPHRFSSMQVWHRASPHVQCQQNATSFPQALHTCLCLGARIRFLFRLNLGMIEVSGAYCSAMSNVALMVSPGWEKPATVTPLGFPYHRSLLGLECGPNTPSLASLPAYQSTCGVQG